VAGVTKVLNHLEVVLPERDYRDDAQLTTTSNNALTENVTVPAGIEATASDGNVRLTGTARFRADRDAAERVIAGLTGVRNIRDDIELVDDVDPSEATFLVLEALDRYALTHQDSDVSVATSGTTVTLAGHVRTWAEHDAVIDAAWMAGGISDVHDQLSVTG
jgi:osmotically-inducible protein OsmY